jgi:predicted O-linked N-acetylglucosamine transferase (SPINDLY family)
LDRSEEALVHCRRAVELEPNDPLAHDNLANVLRELNRLEEAEQADREALRLKPDYAEAHNNLGTILVRLQRLAEAEAAYREAIRLKPDYAEAHNNLGVLLASAGHIPEAEACYREALRFKPDYAEAHNNLGTVLVKRQRLEEAEKAYREALRLKPNFVEAHSNLGLSFVKRYRLKEAEAAYREVLHLKPDHAKVHNDLGLVLVRLHRLEEAEAAFHEALRLEPNLVEAHSNLGAFYTQSGHLPDAEANYRKALQLRPDHADAHSNLIFMLDCVAGVEPEAQQAERRRWYERHARKFAAALAPHDNLPDGERRLRVGYVSGDFCTHSAMHAFWPVLRRHDPAAVEVFCYSNLPLGQEDPLTQELRAASHHWRRIVDLDDDAVAARIREDRIDILVDLSGHTSGNRLLVFARKPAPVQITAWGHATGTGMATMDYLFADPVALPAAIRPLFAEEIIDLPCILTYEVQVDIPPVTPPPVQAGQPITFGSFNRLEKLSDPTLELWARLLRAVPTSRILIKYLNLNEASMQTRLRARFEANGIAGERLVMLGRTPLPEHLAAYSRVDIALDPFPQNGGISTVDALAMGVPVVALPGTTIPSRVTASVLTAMGMPEWIAWDEDEYVAIAARWARNVPGLARLRRKIRPRLARSPLGDHQQYTRAVEQAYRQLWKRWCERQRGQ